MLAGVPFAAVQERTGSWNMVGYMLLGCGVATASALALCLPVEHIKKEKKT